MSWTDRLHQANRWYDGLSHRDGALVSLWCFFGVLIGAILLNHYLGITFWLLLVLGFGGLLAIRLMFRLGKLVPTDGVMVPDPPAHVVLPYADRMLALNQWFDAQTPLARMCHTMGWLYGSFVLNLMLTNRVGLPFGLLFVVVALGMLVTRLGYTHGWLGEAHPEAITAPARRPAIAPPPPMDLATSAMLTASQAPSASEVRH